MRQHLSSMLSGDCIPRRSRLSSLLILSAIFPLATSYALPRQTATVELRELNVLPWPLATAMPESHNEILRRQLNTVCGYIGGDPGLPATCSAGSHCAVDVEHGAVGCCPDGGACSQGVYTGCVDRNSDPQTEINPYVYTCKGGDSCYQNKFEGGYFQYGCGSSSDMAATVAISASGKEGVSFTSLTLELTASVTSLTEPTTIGTKDSSSTTQTTSTTTSTSQTSTTESEPAPTETDGNGGGSGGDGGKDPNDEAPKDNSGSTPVGAIVGGSIGGLAFIVLVATLTLYFLRRKKPSAQQIPPGQTKYMSRDSDDTRDFAPLHPVREVQRSPSPTFLTVTGAQQQQQHGAGDGMRNISPYPPSSSDSHEPTIMGGRGGSMEADRQPLRESSEIDDFTQGYNGALSAIYEHDNESHALSNTIDPNDTDPYDNPYRGRRGQESSALWQQNRRTRNNGWI